MGSHEFGGLGGADLLLLLEALGADRLVLIALEVDSGLGVSATAAAVADDFSASGFAADCTAKLVVQPADGAELTSGTCQHSRNNAS